MKLVIVVPLWKRPVLTDVVLRHLSTIEVPGVNLSVLCIGSEGPASEELAGRYGFEYHERPNVTSNKFNYGFALAREQEADAVMPLGSDDFLTAKYIEDLVGVGDPYVEAAGLYFFDYRTNMLVYLRCPGGVGCGRFISREVLDLIDWQPYQPDLYAGIDVTLTDQLVQKARIKSSKLDVYPPSTGRFILDVKGHDTMEPEAASLWSFRMIALRTSSLVLRPAHDILSEHLPDYFFKTIWNPRPEDAL